MNEQDEEKMGVLEGILFVVGDEGINLESLAQIMISMTIQKLSSAIEIG